MWNPGPGLSIGFAVLDLIIRSFFNLCLLLSTCFTEVNFFLINLDFHLLQHLVFFCFLYPRPPPPTLDLSLYSCIYMCLWKLEDNLWSRQGCRQGPPSGAAVRGHPPFTRVRTFHWSGTCLMGQADWVECSQRSTGLQPPNARISSAWH